MTVREIYKLAAALIGDKENADRDERDLAPQYMTILLQEALNCENSMRERDEQEPLTVAPVLGLDDEVPYHDELARAAFPYGVAWQYHQDAGNWVLAGQYRSMFVEAVNSSHCFTMRKHK